MKRMKLTIAFDMEFDMSNEQTPEDIAHAYSYMIGLGENWRVLKTKIINKKEVDKE